MRRPNRRPHTPQTAVPNGPQRLVSELFYVGEPSFGVPLHTRAEQQNLVVSGGLVVRF